MSRRKLLFAALYFSEGAPIGFVWWAMPTKLRAAGMQVDKIAMLTAVLTLAWALKFLWAPLVDTLRSPRWGFRAWIVTAQIGMGLALVPLIWIPFSGALTLVTGLLLVHSFFAATQDVAVDAYCIASVPEAERGAINGWMQVGMLGGRSIFGGAVLYTEQWLQPRGTIGLMIACIWSTTILVWMSREPPVTGVPSVGGESVTAAFYRTLRRALARRSTWLGLLFAASGGAAFEALGSLTGPLLIDAGISTEQVGLFRAIPVVVGMAIGALLGGYLSDRLGHRRAVALLGILLSVSVLSVGMLLAATEIDTVLLCVLLTVAHVFIGAFTASTYALFMDITDPSLGATQFSAFMGATNLCEAWAVYCAGSLATRHGYPFGLTLLVGVSLLSLVTLRWLRTTTRTTHAHRGAQAALGGIRSVDHDGSG